MRQLAFVLCLIICANGCLQGKQGSDSTRLYLKKNVVPNNGFIDPDKPIIQISRIGGRWVNKIGTSIHCARTTLWGIETQISLDPFIEIHDITTKNYFSWELWRGSFGVNVQGVYEFTNNTSVVLPNLIHMSIGYYHESDHASSWEFTRQFTRYFTFEEFQNSSFGSFEYAKLKTGALHFDKEMTWLIDWSFLIRTFPDPLLKKGGRKQNSSFGAEVFAQQKVSDIFSTHIAWYYEIISTDFVAQEAFFLSDFNKGILIYRVVEVEITYTTSSGTRIIPYIIYTHSAGRGLDFLQTYKELGYGFRVLL